jgi:hypothetical protein
MPRAYEQYIPAGQGRAYEQYMGGGGDEYVNEQHPDITFKDRFLLKNVSPDPEARARWIQENKGMETRVVDDAVQVRKPGEAEWRGLEARGKFELSDISDITSDVTAGISTGLGAVAGGLLGAPTGPGALATGAAGGAAGAGLHEAAQQALASSMGMGKETLGGALGDIGKEAAFGALAEVGGRALGAGSRFAAKQLGGEAGEGLVGMGARKLMANLGRGRATQAAGETLQAPTRMLGQATDVALGPPQAKNAMRNATAALQDILRPTGASGMSREIQKRLVKEGITPEVRKRILSDLARGTTTSDEVLRAVKTVRPAVFESMEKMEQPIGRALVNAKASLAPLRKGLGHLDHQKMSKKLTRAGELFKTEKGVSARAESLIGSARFLDEALSIAKKAKPQPTAGLKSKALDRVMKQNAEIKKAKQLAVNIGKLRANTEKYFKGVDLKAITAIGRKAMEPVDAFMSVIGKLTPETARGLPYMVSGAGALGIPMAGAALPVAGMLAGTHALGGLLRSIGRAPSVQAKEKLLAAWLKKNAESPLARGISDILKKRGVRSALAALYVRAKREER